MNLYELTANYLALQQMLEDPEADMQMINDTMEAIDGDIEDKADGYAKVMKNMESSIPAIDAEIDRLTARKNLLELGIKTLKRNLYESMKAIGKEKFKTKLFTFNIQKNGGSLPVILDVPVEKLPDECVVVEEKANLKAIAKLLQDPKNKEYYSKFAHLGERGEGLRIK